MRTGITRPSSPLFHPTKLGADLLSWFDAEHTSMITESGGIVSSWTDYVTGNALTQSTGASRPALVASGFSGRPVVSFDGSDDYLEAASVWLPTGSSPCRVYALVSQPIAGSVATANFILSWGGVSTNVNRSIGRGASGGSSILRVITGLSGSSVTVSPSDVFDGQHAAYGRWTATTTYAALGFGTEASSAAVPATGTTRTRMAANTANTAAANAAIDIAAILATSDSISAVDHGKLIAWLLRRK